MMTDEKSLTRTAQRLVVEVRRGTGSPPSYSTNWEPIWGAKVDRIEINSSNRPSVATIWFPQLRWEQSPNLKVGDNIRVRTNQPAKDERTIVFAGFVTSYLSGFTGGSDSAPGYERNAVVCQSYRWLLAITSPVFGQVARGPDDYTDYGTVDQQPISNSYVFLSGQRVVFNQDGRPNRDPTLCTVEDTAGNEQCEVPIFADPDVGEYWTARDMIRYLLCRFYNIAYEYWPISDPNLLAGLDHSDFDKVLGHIVADGQNVIDAVVLICKHLGWDFREDYSNDGEVNIVFYKLAAASGYVRSADKPTIFHQLHAPAVGENINIAIAEGRKMLWAMDLAEDITSVVNNPWGLGAPHQFEFTAELVPAWGDADLEPDTSNDYANLFFTDAELQDETDPNKKSYYKYYYPRGDSFRRDVGRKWSLNETGRYSINTKYDRGVPFDFASVVPEEYICDSKGKRLFAPFGRQLLPCLTVDPESLNSVGIKVEFSFDGGITWQVIPSSISSLKDECGIYIDEANLAEIVDQSQGLIEEGDLAELQLNYWTSLCDDKLNSHSFKDGQWLTRVRVTASAQLDQRLCVHPSPSSASGSPFHHSQIYDFSEKYSLLKRTLSSVFAGTDLPAWDLDSTEWFNKHLEAVRTANEDMSVSAQFTLERLWLGDGSGLPDFAVGDCIEKITGREYDLSAAFGNRTVYPEIIQIIYLPNQQKMKLITRDLRFAEVLL